jgi:hypothetical protein
VKLEAHARQIPAAARAPILGTGVTKIKELTDPMLAPPIIGDMLRPIIDRVIAMPIG